MSLNRRDFIVTSVAIAGSTSVIASATASTTDHNTHLQNTPSKHFDPSNEPNRIRKNFYDLSDEELQTFMKAVGFMRNNYKLRDPRQWDNYALVHALHCTEANKAHPQVHWGWNFLPWHRGYLYFLERILANILTNELGLDGTKFALPYWDWSHQHGMPNTKIREQAGLSSPFFGYDPTKEDMTADDGLGFDNSALYDGNRGPTIQKPQMDPANELTAESKEHVAITRYYMSSDYINMCLASPWDQFGGQPVTDRNTGQGLIEAGPHNCGHDWVGIRFGKNRNMGTLRCAAVDPIFFMHHCNIDRIWSLYSLPQPDPTGDWGKPVYHWTDIDGKQVIATAEDIITKFTNISYAESYSSVLKSTKPTKTVEFSKILINKVLSNEPIEITLPQDFPFEKPTLIDIETGPISYTGKYIAKILAGDKQVGILNFMDGDYREDNVDPNLTHWFTVLLTVQPGTQTLVIIPPKRSTVGLTIKSIKYGSL